MVFIILPRYCSEVHIEMEQDQGNCLVLNSSFKNEVDFGSQKHPPLFLALHSAVIAAVGMPDLLWH